jgi:2-polyprenyl-3-methyl-5-hydroxy-6-metoxy-1,4-benzoquinol methylase
VWRAGPLWQALRVAEYLDVNRAHWDERAPGHAASPDYNVRRFAEDPEHLSDVVRFDLPRLGDVRGLRGLHLQCHIGTDTISLARLGAHMRGLDFSGASLAEARRIAQLAGADVDFVQADVYQAPQVLEREQFDLVYTGIGALGWLPSVRRWAAVVAELLRPGGRLFIREAHPVLWSIDETRPDGLLVLDLPYFETEQPLVWTEEGTYVATDTVFRHTTTHSWNHGLGEIVTALSEAGMRLTTLVEHDSVPWEALPGRMYRDGHEWRLSDRPNRLPLTYTIQATKDA